MFKNKKAVILLVLILLVIPLVSAYYYGFGSWGMRWFQLGDFYYQYQTWIDFFVFLLIFMGLGRSIFGQHYEKAGGAAVYTGVGIFLSLALVLWEERAGFSLYNFFPLAFFVIIALFCFYIAQALRKASGSTVLGISLSYIVFWLFISGNLERLFEDYLYKLPFDIYGAMYFLFIISLIVFFYSFIRFIVKLFKGGTNA
jgi:hypothetical protein